MDRPIWRALGHCFLIWACGWLVESAAQEPTWPREWMSPSGATYKLRGRLDTDAIQSAQSEKNIADFGELNDVVGLRRARIGLEGTLTDDHPYVAEIDLAGGDLVIRDLYVGQLTEGDAEQRLGHFREPFSLEGGTSARYFAFMERSPADTLDPARNWGCGLLALRPTDDTAFAIGGFFGGSDSNDFEAGAGSTASLTAKLTAAPINEDQGRKLLHLGVAASERLPLDNTIVIGQGPTSSLLSFDDTTSAVFVSNIIVPANFQHLLNGQFAMVNQSWWTQADWYGTWIEMPDGSTVFYHGSHFDVGCFLTGENREYNASTGVFGPVTVRRPFLHGPASRGRRLGAGAWELTARYSWADFFDADAPLNNGEVQGVELPEATFGVNWYLTDRVRLMFNYTYAAPIDPMRGQSSANVFGTRLGVFW